jgi:hypothetical protein
MMPRVKALTRPHGPLSRFIDAASRSALLDLFGDATPSSSASEAEALHDDWAAVGDDLRTSMLQALDELSEEERDHLLHELVEAR